MPVENAVCPYCRKEVLVTVPNGQYLVQINRSETEYVDTSKQDYHCPHCDYNYVTETACHKDLRR
jgi:transposase-like protein